MIKGTLASHALLAAALSLVVGCSKQVDEVAATQRFDAKAIAAEADKGNLGPLKDLNTACSAEVEKTGSRGSACAAQDEVGGLRKPMNLKIQ